MKGLCINASGLTVLEAGQEYFVFPGSSNTFYVSKFNNEKAHFGAFQRYRFEVIDDQENILQLEISESKEPIEEKFDQLVQMDLFEFLGDDQSEDIKGIAVTIPEDVISPLDCKNSPKSKAFKKVQHRWSVYVKSVQDYHKCSWFEASKKLLKHKKEGSFFQVTWDPKTNI
ncbi:hypothetical protein ACTWP4_18745 [Gracilibacillus sp. D59]|uniref:hypothetical protein n=1 Tax=Gracilibacillus sp. D59 TaxID=3457434 RepID=UPI003FCCA449